MTTLTQSDLSQMDQEALRKTIHDLMDEYYGTGDKAPLDLAEAFVNQAYPANTHKEFRANVKFRSEVHDAWSAANAKTNPQPTADIPLQRRRETFVQRMNR